MGILVALSLARPALALGAHDVNFEWMALRADIEEVQNTTGNAFALRGGWSPTLQLEPIPIGLRLLLEYGALRTTTGQVFSVPSVQLLATWTPAERLELAAGAGAQFWVAPNDHDARLVVTLEAHYVLPTRFLKVIRSGFAAASIGPSSTSGLQARLGLEFRFGAQPKQATQTQPITETTVVPQRIVPEPATPLVCPPCPSCPECPPAPSCPVPLATKNVVLPTPVLFAFDSSHVLPEGAAYLMRLGAGLAAHKDDWVTLALTGHANAVGAAGHNLILSVARAKAVADVLQTAGVSEHQLTISGVGATQPIAGSAPEDATQQRVMLELLGGHISAELQTLLDGASQLPKESAP